MSYLTPYNAKNHLLEKYGTWVLKKKNACALIRWQQRNIILRKSPNDEDLLYSIQIQTKIIQNSKCGINLSELTKESNIGKKMEYIEFINNTNDKY